MGYRIEQWAEVIPANSTLRQEVVEFCKEHQLDFLDCGRSVIVGDYEDRCTHWSDALIHLLSRREWHDVQVHLFQDHSNEIDSYPGSRKRELDDVVFIVVHKIEECLGIRSDKINFPYSRYTLCDWKDMFPDMKLPDHLDFSYYLDTV